MRHRYPCGGWSRRSFLAASALSGASVPTIEGAAGADEPPASAIARTTHHGGSIREPGPMAAPGLHPGRVVEVRNPAMIRGGKKDAGAIRAAMDLGIKALTGATDPVEGWRHFFGPGDVVGIKVVPNGQPFAHSSFEVVLEVIEKLRLCGVKAGDMFVYDRFRGELMDAGYHRIVPEGVRCGGLDPVGDQFRLDFPDHARDPIAGFDRDAYVWMDLIPYGDDPKDDRLYRSHLGTLVSRTLNKIVAIPVLKDHGAAGVTGALKNMSHGSVNNVDRSHHTPFTNVVNQFIPQMVLHPTIRGKFVLHLMDGIRGVYHGGPFAPDVKRTWESNRLLFATDPVALDHVEWDLVDAERKARGLPPVAASGKAALDPTGSEGFDVRQPQHIALAGALGLGRFDYRSNRGRRHSIDHRVVSA